MSETTSVTLDGIPSADVALVELYAAAQGVSVSSLALTHSLGEMVQLGIQVAAGRFAATTTAIPAALLAELETVSGITNALVRLREAGADLSAIVAAVPAA